VPELERWQHAAAAALVGARWGVAGLRTVIADTRHRSAGAISRFSRSLSAIRKKRGRYWKYLETPGAHHAFVAASVEAARYYPGRRTM